ncbi:hypothetical protein EV356DRAFT_254932 [Viridothelium virens]|uniref:MH1 domain-containing protein n=1 Tax=Viridothelium virens TaxID=1048519 RepID=A0A6A6H2M5_VIRVR|nr:hypothetical protein EV356DRAFT_254932 [Viridothelium virens]
MQTKCYPFPGSDVKDPAHRETHFVAAHGNVARMPKYTIRYTRILDLRRLISCRSAKTNALISRNLRVRPLYINPWHIQVEKVPI